MTTDEITAVEATETAPNTAVEAAQAEIERLYLAERKLCQEYQERIGRIREYTPLAGDAILQGALADGTGDINIEAMRTTALIDQLSTLNADIAAIEQAITAARQRRVEAIKRLYAAQAAVMRREAAQIRSEADAIDAEMQPHLEALKELAGVAYGPINRPAGDVLQFNGADHPLPAGPMVFHTSLPRPVLLRDKAAGLDRSADALEAKPVQSSGQIESGAVQWHYTDPMTPKGATTSREGAWHQTQAASLPDVIEQLRALGPLVIAPVETAVIDWAETALAAVARRIPRHDRPYVLRLIFHNGTIDEKQSKIAWAGEN